MKKIISILCALTVLFGVIALPASAAATRKNFYLRCPDCPFTDIPEGHYAKNDIQDAYFWGIIKGNDDNTYHPNEPASLLFLLQTAVRMWDLYMGGEGCLPIEYGYDMLYKTAYNAGLLKNVEGYEIFENLDTRYASRKQMSRIFVNTMPEYEFTPINILRDGPADMTDDAVKKLYMAGVLLGNGVAMNENAVVTRAEVAVAANRIATWRIEKPSDYRYDTLLGEFATNYNQGNYGRSYNIALAASSFNGKILYPSERFSFNGVVGSRSAARGYMNASVLVDGDYVDGIGGGVCQVSSTLFNAALMSNMKIIERHAHSLPAAYVAKGRDATVYYGSLDFVFENSLSSPVQIRASAENGVLYIAVWGDYRDKQNDLSVWVEQSNGAYTLVRSVNGNVNYTAKSKYQ